MNHRAISKAKLDSVLINVAADSNTTLSSEAYALLRFNTEYVLKDLREYDADLATENSSSSPDATATNNARHLAKSGEYLHEVFNSGGEIFYRRSGDGASSWDQTHWLNTAVGENSHPCITVTESGTLQLVWQRKVAPSVYELWHSYSNDNGETWSAAAKLHDNQGVEVSEYQSQGATPVIAEVKEISDLVVVYCSSEGLRYMVSDNDGESWEIPDPDIISGQYDDRVRFPSIAGGTSYLSLVYDYAGDEYSPWSRIFDGSRWSDEYSIGKETGTGEGEYSSVAIDANNDPVAAWSGISMNLQYGRVVTFRAGYSDNSWSDWFVEFGQSFVDWLNPSLTYYNREGDQYGIAIVNHTSQDLIKLIRLVSVSDPPEWDISTFGESGAWANVTPEHSTSGMPFFCWTDQEGPPHEITVETSGEFSMARTSGVMQKRRAIVYHRDLGAALSLEFEPLRIVDANGDTSLVPFKSSFLRSRGKINLMNMWDYLGSDTVSLSANAAQLIISKQFAQRGPSIAQRQFSLHALSPDGKSIALLDTTSSSGTVSVDIEPYAGREIVLRPKLLLTGITPPSVAVGVGDVFMVRDKQSNAPKSRKE